MSRQNMRSTNAENCPISHDDRCTTPPPPKEKPAMEVRGPKLYGEERPLLVLLPGSHPASILLFMQTQHTAQWGR
jgi:hypothetical protein